MNKAYHNLIRITKLSVLSIFYIFISPTLYGQIDLKSSSFKIAKKKVNYYQQKGILEELLNLGIKTKIISPTKIKNGEIAFTSISVDSTIFIDTLEPNYIESFEYKTINFNLGGLYFENNFFNKGVEFNNIKTAFLLYKGNSSKSISLYNCNVSTSWLSNLLATKKIIISNSNLPEIIFWPSKSVDSLSCDFHNSTIGNFSFQGGGDYIYRNFRFYDDSLLTDVSFFHDQTPNKVAIEKLDIHFRNCYINSRISNLDENVNVNFYFTDCEFGPDADLNLLADTVVFLNCHRTNFPLRLNLNPSCNKSTVLYFSMTDLTNINFSYNENTQLSYYLSASSNDEETAHTFEMLYHKYKKEGKSNSFKKLDIEYTQYKYRRMGKLGKILNWFDSTWWYYGYRKEFVFLWTTGFLVVFFLLNIKYWGKIHSAYPIVPDIKNKYYDNLHKTFKGELNYLLKIFVFTALIFFSLRIDFGKLSYKSSRYLVLFFLQFLVGLICIFFIINWLLKL